MTESSLIGNLWGPLLKPEQPSMRMKISDMARPGTKTLDLLSSLAHSPASTASLAQNTGLTQRKVWGLLKQPKDKGAVTYDPASGIWQLNADYQGPAIDRAKALLESQGWKCIPPSD